MLTQTLSTLIYSKENHRKTIWLLKLLIAGTPLKERYNFEGILYFLEGDIDRSVKCFLTQLKFSNQHKNAYTNLSFLSSSYCNEDQNERIFTFLEKELENSNYFLKLKLSTCLSFNLSKAKKMITEQYIDKWISPSILNSTKKKTILFFHLPKCGGTTTTNSLHNYFYKSKLHCLPSYTEFNLLKYCIEECPDAFPYISTKHVGLEKLEVDFNQFQTFTIIRDPLKRNISAFRQSVSGKYIGRAFKIIPKYGSYWNYYNLNSFDKWMSQTPKKELLRQISTFSPLIESNEFKENIGKVNFVIPLDKFNSPQMDKVFTSFGLSDKAIIDFNKKLNKSNKNIKIDSSEVEKAKRYFMPYQKWIEDVKKL